MIWIDCNQISKVYSVENIYDAKANEVGHIPYTNEFFSVLATHIFRTIYALKTPPFKVIVCDCDNTLWQGVCAEDGLDGIEINTHFNYVQAFLKRKYDEGFLIALCSKNNEFDVWNVFENHPGMLLKKEHIASHRINWNKKSDNIKEIAKALNLNESSFIFIDDNPLEIEEVSLNCPSVLAIQLPENSESFSSFLNQVWSFDKIKITDEDKLRNSLYNMERIRDEEKVKYSALDDYIKALELVVSVQIMMDEDLVRATQLTQRTNQFNLNGIVMTEEQLNMYSNSPDYNCYVIKVKDKFGDYGLVGVVLTQNVNCSKVIELFLLSCRVLGRNIEKEVFDYIVQKSKMEGFDSVELNYKETARNAPFKNFLDAYTELEYNNESYSICIKNSLLQ